MGPIRGQTRPLPIAAGIMPEVQHVDTKLNASIHNRFDIEVVDTETGLVRQRAQAENIILNQCWTYMLTAGSEKWFNYIQIGTGTGAPSSGRTSLFAFLLAKQLSDTPKYTENKTDVSIVGIATRSTQLGLNEANGKTLTEIGISYDSGSKSLCTHALLKDANGNPISITKTDTDIINIYATVYLHAAKAQSSGAIITSLSTYKYLTGAVSGNGTQIGLWHGSEVGYEMNVPMVSRNSVYNVSAKTISTSARIPADTANYSIGSIYLNAIYFPSGANWYGGSDIVGEAVGTGDGVTTDFSTAFHNASNATIYVDGVAQTTAVTVENFPDCGTPGYLMRGLNEDGTVGGTKPTMGSGYSGYTYYFYNPRYETVGITELYDATHWYVSNDFVTWTPLTTAVVPAQYQHYKYWKKYLASSNETYAIKSISKTNKDVHFSSAPASGAVITADYHTSAIAKDSNHVFDFSMTIQLGENTT